MPPHFALIAALLAAAPQPPLSIVFEDASGLQPIAAAGRIDAGTLSARGAQRATYRAVVRVRVQGKTSARFARLRAGLDDGTTRCKVRIDGILLSAVPQMIDALAPLGRAVTHTLEIEVPASEPPAPLASSIVWLAETD
jgi:hypothetical protein